MLHDIARMLSDPTAQALSDGFIVVACLVIPAALIARGSRFKSTVSPPALLFAALLLLCGAGHRLDLLTPRAAPGLDGIIKVVTACVAVMTALTLWQLPGRAAAMPQPSPLRHTEAALCDACAPERMAGQIGGIGYWRLELPGRLLNWSDAALRIFGMDPGATPPALPAAMAAYHSEDRGRVAEEIEYAIAEQRGFATIARLLRQHGDIRHVQIRAAPEFRADGSMAALLGVVIDLSEHQARPQPGAPSLLTQQETAAANVSLERLNWHLKTARDRAERANQAKSRFLASLSHELRTPLTGILGYAQLLRMDGGLGPTQSFRVDAMLSAGTHLLQMVNRVLDLSEIEAEQVELRPVDVDPRQLAAECLDLVRPAAQAKRLTLDLAVAAEIPAHCIVDPTGLRRLLLNLLGNAVKFTNQGSVTLRMRLTEHTCRLRVEVADTGPGVSADQQNRLFQDFERLNANSSVEGTGLGLALSTRLAILMGGHVGYQDNPGGGSLFWLELPLVAESGPASSSATGARTVEPAEAEPPAPVPAAGLRVLVVDDVALNRDVAQSFLSAMDYECAFAEGGCEAVAAAAAGDFDLVLMDVRMPGVDGLEATRQIRALDGGRGQVPIVALTAQVYPEQVAECRKAGTDGHLAKPFTPDMLITALADGIASAKIRVQAGPEAADVCHEPAHAKQPASSGARNASNVPVLDLVALERTAAFFTSEQVASYLRHIARQSEALLATLHPSGAVRTSHELADAAHALAGSAGMFGFERLSVAARHFEHATRTELAETSILADSMSAALQTTLEEIYSRAPAQPGSGLDASSAEDWRNGAHGPALDPLKAEP